MQGYFRREEELKSYVQDAMGIVRNRFGSFDRETP